MKESNILAGDVVHNFLRRDIWLHTKRQYMKESNTLAGNAVNNFLRDILLNTKGKYMKYPAKGRGGKAK